MTELRWAAGVAGHGGPAQDVAFRTALDELAAEAARLGRDGLVAFADRRLHSQGPPRHGHCRRAGG